MPTLEQVRYDVTADLAAATGENDPLAHDSSNGLLSASGNLAKRHFRPVKSYSVARYSKMP
ncbi:hypothetical protein NKH89_08300 [Mesorhizobium sp. M0923]|uniref:hypothetical protein n=1 Tax=Mesorhizobium sp. M0923 TaxID=2957028 RepID=UPI00333C2E7B